MGGDGTFAPDHEQEGVTRSVDRDVEFVLLGRPDDGPTLRLDHREFAYAGKFVMSATGKAVLRPAADGRAADTGPGPDDGDDRNVLAAVAFDADRTDPDTLVVRYVTVREDRRGEGLGPHLLSALLDGIDDYDRARIAVNNPFAYEALYRAGFAFTGRETGIAELVLERPVGRAAAGSAEQYRVGMERFAERDLTDAERPFVRERVERGPPGTIPGVDRPGTDGPAGDDGRHR